MSRLCIGFVTLFAGLVVSISGWKAFQTRIAGCLLLRKAGSA